MDDDLKTAICGAIHQFKYPDDEHEKKVVELAIKVFKGENIEKIGTKIGSNSPLYAKYRINGSDVVKHKALSQELSKDYGFPLPRIIEMKGNLRNHWFNIFFEKYGNPPKKPNE